MCDWLQNSLAGATASIEAQNQAVQALKDAADQVDQTGRAGARTELDKGKARKAVPVGAGPDPMNQWLREVFQ